MVDNNRQDKPTASAPKKLPVKLNIRNTLIIAAVVIAAILIFVFGINKWKIEFKQWDHNFYLIKQRPAHSF